MQPGTTYWASKILKAPSTTGESLLYANVVWRNDNQAGANFANFSAHRSTVLFTASLRQFNGDCFQRFQWCPSQQWQSLLLAWAPLKTVWSCTMFTKRPQINELPPVYSSYIRKLSSWSRILCAERNSCRFFRGQTTLCQHSVSARSGLA